jgi:hypothetical protein
MRRAPLLLAWLCLATTASSASAGTAWLEDSLPPEVASVELERVRDDVRRLVAEGKRPVVVFDVDETLVISDRGIYWDPKLRRMPGAKEYLKGLLEDGARIIYFTGRKTSLWRKRRSDPPGTLTPRQKTIRELRRLDIPLGPGTELIMNPTQHRGYVFKELFVPRLRRKGTIVALFDNEKDISRLFREQYPDARVFRLNTRAKYGDIGIGTGGIKVIDDFLIRPSLTSTIPAKRVPLRSSIKSVSKRAPARYPYMADRRSQFRSLVVKQQRR